MSLLRRHLRSGISTSALVAVLVAVTVFVMAIAPRALERLGTDELRYELRNATAARVDLSGRGPMEVASGPDAASVFGAIDLILAGIPSGLPAPLSDGAGETSWLVRTQAVRVPPRGLPPATLSLKLAIDLRWTERVRFVEGESPAVATRGADGAIEIALSRLSADEIGVGVGDLIEGDPTIYRVAGIYEAVDPGDGYWQHARDLLEPAVVRELDLEIQTTAFVDPDSVAALDDEFAAGEVSAWVPLDPDAYRYSDLETLGSQARATTATSATLPSGSPITFRSELDKVLKQTRSSVSAISALIALSASGFVAVLIAAYALCIQAVIRRRRTVLALASARGAAPRQLRTVMMLEAAAISLPGSVVAILVAAAVLPVDAGPAGILVPAIVGLIPIALAGILTSTGTIRQGRDDLGSRWSGSSRWVVEVAVLALAVIAVFLLQRRGLVASSAVVGIDPLLSAVPVLLAAAAGLLVLRLYPIPLRAIQRALRRRRAPAASLGAARAIRQPAVGLVGTLALVTGISITVFTTVMISTVGHGLRQAAEDQVGADLQIAAHDLPATLVTDIADLPQIDAAVALTSVSGIAFSDEAGPSEVSVLMADTRALHAVRPDIPVLVSTGAGALPILVSSDWADRIAGTELHVANSLAVQQDVIASDALPGMSRQWILVDSSAAAELDLDALVADRVLATLAPGADSPDAVAAVRDLVVAAQSDIFTATVRVDDAESLLVARRAAPVTSGLETSLVIVSIAALALTMLVVALAALTAAASRNRVVGVLRVLGMSPRQVRSLVAWEFTPVAAVAVLVGTALGLGLPYLVTTVLDLRGFFGGTTLPQPALEPAWVAGAVGAFVVAVVLAVGLATAAGRRLAPAGVLKMGEE